jgi:hypothetical protein
MGSGWGPGGVPGGPKMTKFGHFRGPGGVLMGSREGPERVLTGSVRASHCLLDIGSQTWPGGSRDGSLGSQMGPGGVKNDQFWTCCQIGSRRVPGGSQMGPDRACQRRPLYPIHWAPDWPRRGPKRVPGGPKGSQIGQKSSNLMNFGHFEILGVSKNVTF